MEDSDTAEEALRFERVKRAKEIMEEMQYGKEEG